MSSYSGIRISLLIIRCGVANRAISIKSGVVSESIVFRVSKNVRTDVIRADVLLGD